MTKPFHPRHFIKMILCIIIYSFGYTLGIFKIEELHDLYSIDFINLVKNKIMGT